MRKWFLPLALVSLAALLLSGCSTGRGASWPALTSDGELAYLAGGSYVYAIRLSDGTEVWRFPAKANRKLAFYAAPALTPEGHLIIGSSGTTHTLFSLDPASLDPESGEPLIDWTFDDARDRWIAAPLVTETGIYAPNVDGNLYALDFQGRPLWSEPFSAGGPLWSRPASDGEHLYVASLDHRLFAVDAATGQAVWADSVTLDGALAGSPALGDSGTLFIGSFGSHMHAVDATTGHIRWSIPTKGWVWGGPVVNNQTVYFGDLEGYFYALDTENGEQRWPSIQPDGSVIGTPLVLDEQIVFTTEAGSVYAVSETGEILWSTQVGGKLYAPPVLAGDFILVAPLEADFLIAALDRNGNQVWTFTPEK